MIGILIYMQNQEFQESNEFYKFKTEDFLLKMKIVVIEFIIHLIKIKN